MYGNSAQGMGTARRVMRTMGSVWERCAAYGNSVQGMGTACSVWEQRAAYGNSVQGMGRARRVWEQRAGYGKNVQGYGPEGAGLGLGAADKNCHLGL